MKILKKKMKPVMNKFILLALFIFGMCQAADAETFKADEFMLDNGLRVVVVENHKAPLVKQMLWYQVGAVDEFRGRGGSAHLLEHILFRGTKKVSGKEFNRIMEQNGAVSNAFTGYNVTAYHQFADVSRLEVLMALEADRMQNLKISEDDFEAERKIVFQERKQVVENNPASPFGERLRQMLWGTSPYGQPITGLPEDIMALKFDETLDFYHKYYAPNNAILVLSGDIDSATARKLTEKYYGKLEKRPVEREQPEVQTEHFEQTLKMQLPKITAPKISITYLLPDHQNLVGSIYDYMVLAEFLGDGETSELYRELVLKRKTALGVSASYNYISRANTTFGISMTPDASVEFSPEKSVEDLQAALKKGMNNLTAERLEQIKRKMLADLVFTNDNPETAAYWIGYMLSLGFSLDEVQNYADRINNVTLEGVKNAFAAVEKASKVVGILLPSDEQDGGQNEE